MQKAWNCVAKIVVQAITQNGGKLSPLACNNIKSIYFEPLTCSSVLNNLFITVALFPLLNLLYATEVMAHPWSPRKDRANYSLSSTTPPLSNSQQAKVRLWDDLLGVSVDFTAAGFQQKSDWQPWVQPSNGGPSESHWGGCSFKCLWNGDFTDWEATWRCAKPQVQSPGEKNKTLTVTI